MYLLDTNALMDLLNENENVLARFAENAGSVWVSSVAAEERLPPLPEEMESQQQQAGRQGNEHQHDDSLVWAGPRAVIQDEGRLQPKAVQSGDKGA